MTGVVGSPLGQQKIFDLKKFLIDYGQQVMVIPNRQTAGAQEMVKGILKCRDFLWWNMMQTANKPMRRNHRGTLKHQWETIFWQTSGVVW